MGVAARTFRVELGPLRRAVTGSLGLTRRPRFSLCAQRASALFCVACKAFLSLGVHAPADGSHATEHVDRAHARAGGTHLGHLLSSAVRPSTRAWARSRLRWGAVKATSTPPPQPKRSSTSARYRRADPPPAGDAAADESLRTCRRCGRHDSGSVDGFVVCDSAAEFEAFCSRLMRVRCES